LKREVLWLVAGVLLIDVVFAAIYFLAHLRTTTDTTKIAFTLVWTLATLGLVLRGLSRIRRLRLGPDTRR
jgi:hypothetical protein